MFENIFFNKIRSVIEDILEKKSEYIAKTLLRLSAKEPHIMAGSLFTALGKLSKKDLEKYKPELKKVLEAGMADDWRYFQKIIAREKEREKQHN